MSLRAAWITAVLGTAAALVLLLSTEEWGIPTASEAEPDWKFLLEDPHDRSVDMLYGYWLPSRTRPYLDEFSPYPQVTTWMMGVPWLFLDHQVRRGEPIASIDAAVAVLVQAGLAPEDAEDLARTSRTARRQLGGRAVEARTAALQQLARVPGLDVPAAQAALQKSWDEVDLRDEQLVRHRLAYGDIHQVEMALMLAGVFALMGLCLRELGCSPAWMLVLLLPGTLYHTLNRHEPLLLLFLLGAVLLQMRGRVRWAAALLGLAAMTKLWPAFLIPIFASHAFHSERARLRSLGQAARLGPLLWTRVIAPGLVAAAVCVGIFAVTVTFQGGLAAIPEFFAWHKDGRQPNHSSLLTLLTTPERWGWFAPENRDALERVFKGLQLVPALALALLPLRTREALIHAVVFTGLGCAQFSEFSSPQWVLWAIPPALLLAGRYWPYRWLAPMLALWIYLQLPLFFYHEVHALQLGGEVGSTFWAIVDGRVVIYVAFQAAALVGLFRSLRQPDPAATIARLAPRAAA